MGRVFPVSGWACRRAVYSLHLRTSSWSSTSEKKREIANWIRCLIRPACGKAESFRHSSHTADATHLTLVDPMVPLLYKLNLQGVGALHRLMCRHEACVISIQTIARRQNVPVPASHPRYLVLRREKRRRNNNESIAGKSGTIMIGENNKVNDAETFRGFRSEEKYLMMQRVSERIEMCLPRQTSSFFPRAPPDELTGRRERGEE